MSGSARQHNEWLSLVDVSGPFLTLSVLLEVFPHGLEDLDTELRRRVRRAFDEFEEANDPSVHRRWVEFVLTDLLGFEDLSVPQALAIDFAEHHETLRPDYAVADRRLLIQVYQSSQNLERPIPKSHWKASPATRMMELLHATGVRLGLVTNGIAWMLVNAPRGETTGTATWYANLVDRRASHPARLQVARRCSPLSWRSPGLDHRTDARAQRQRSARSY